MSETKVRPGDTNAPHGFVARESGGGARVKVVFLPVTEELAQKCRETGLPLNSAIPVPVELPENTGEEASLPALLRNLTVEMLVAGMIRAACSYAAAGKTNDEVYRYYRSFVLAFKPDILAEFTGAATAHIQAVAYDAGAYDRAREAVAALEGLFPDSREVAALKSMLGEKETRACGEADYSEAYRLIRECREEEAMGKLRKFLERHPDSWNGWFMLGWALRRLKRWEDAAACFRKSIEASGLHPDASNELAICLMESGDYDGARACLERALSEDARNTKLN
jgi:tetratricopeptide (TPR) repeat protein